jgi:hypothetical protein
MSQESDYGLDPRMQGAVDEVRAIIRQRYPEASFSVSRGIDEPEQIHLTTAVDIDDPDDVLNLVLDRLLQLEIDEGIPLYLIPIRTPERTLADLEGRTRPHRHLARIGQPQR